MITRESAETLGLAIGMEISALVKSSSVLLLTDRNVRTSARNHLWGEITRIHDGPGGPELELLAGNAARLRPLLDADGFAELPETLTEAQPGHCLAFHPFERQFAT